MLSLWSLSLSDADASSSVFGSDDTGATTSYTTAQEKDEVEVAGMDCEPTIAYSMGKLYFIRF